MMIEKKKYRVRKRVPRESQFC